MSTMESDEATVKSPSDENVTISHTWGSKGYLDASYPSPDITVCIVGDEQTGKSCLAQTLAGKQYTEIKHSAYFPEALKVNITHTVNWVGLTEQEKIDDLLKQMIQESKHCATQQIKAKKEDTSTTFVPTHPDNTKGMYLLPMPEFCKFTGVTEKYNPGKKFITIWECDGSKVFHPYQSLLLSPEMVCVVAFDASKLHDRNTDDVHSAKAVVKGICNWMEMVTSRLCKKTTSDGALSEFYPTFMFVGTKLDLMGMDMKEAEEFARKLIIPLLQEELANKPYARYIVGSKNGRLLFEDDPCVFFLSNLDDKRNPKVIATIQKKLIQAAPPPSNRPTWYTRFERELMVYACRKREREPRKPNEPEWSYIFNKPDIFTPSLAPIEEVTTIGKDCGITNSKELLKGLQYLHQKGTFLHFTEVPCLAKAVIVHHRWITKLLTYILSNISCHPAGPPLGIFAQERSEQGLMNQELLDWCIETFNNNEKRHGESIMDVDSKEIMQMFFGHRLAIEVTHTALVDKTNDDCRKGLPVYFMPYFLEFEENRKPNQDTYIILYHFQSGFIADVLFHKLMFKCGEWSKAIESECLKASYNWICMELGRYQAYHFRCMKEDAVIRLTILPSPELTVKQERESVIESNKLIASLAEFMRDLIPEFTSEAGAIAAVEVYVPCPKCDKLHIKIERVALYGFIYCPYNECHVDVTKYWRLLSFGVTSKGLTVKGPERPKTIPAFATLMTQEPSMKLLHKIVIPRILERWRDVATYLEYDIPTTEAIKKNCREDDWDCCVELLRDWLSTDHGSAPKVWHTLMENLKENPTFRPTVADIEKELKDLASK